MPRKNVYTSVVGKGSSVTLPHQIAEKYRIRDGDKVVFVEFGENVLLMSKTDFKDRLDPFISGSHPLERINKNTGKRIVLEAIRYLTRISNEDVWFSVANIAKIVDISGPSVFTALGYKTLERYLEELTDEGMLIKTEAGLSDGKPTYAYRAKV